MLSDVTTVCKPFLRYIRRPLLGTSKLLILSGPPHQLQLQSEPCRGPHPGVVVETRPAAISTRRVKDDDTAQCSNTGAIAVWTMGAQLKLGVTWLCLGSIGKV